MKPLEYNVGESKGKAQTPFLQALPVATPRRGTETANINTGLLPPKALGKPPQRGSERDRAGRSPFGNSSLSSGQPLSGQLISNKTLFPENNRAQSSTAGRPSQPPALNKALIM